MVKCERLQRCPFFKTINHLPETAAQLARSYCYGEVRSCARFLLHSMGVQPPADLFPNEEDRALRLLVDAGKLPASALSTIKGVKRN
jgi:hypothetical protein